MPIEPHPRTHCEPVQMHVDVGSHCTEHTVDEPQSTLQCAPFVQLTPQCVAALHLMPQSPPSHAALQSAPLQSSVQSRALHEHAPCGQVHEPTAQP
jgi:hypothetical protein